MLATLTTSSNIKKFGYGRGLKIILNSAGRFALSRGFISLTWISNGIIFAKLGDDAVAAGPLITSITFSILGAARGTLFAAGIQSGIFFGSNQYKKIGEILRLSYGITIVIDIPCTAIMLNIGKTLELIEIDKNVAQLVQEYFNFFSIATLPILLLSCDQQLALAVKKPGVAFWSNAIFSLLTIAFSVPLSLGLFNFPNLGIAGIAHGYTASATITWLARVYDNN